MVTRVLAVALLSSASTFVLGQTAKSPDLSAGPVPPAIQQMPDRFQPPVPGCTDCYYTVPSGKVLGAMGTTNNEGVKVTHPFHSPALPTPTASTHALPSTAYKDLVFKSGNNVWPIRSAVPLTLYIGSAVGLSRTASSTLPLTSPCDLHSLDYTTLAGNLTALPIPLSLWDVTAGTKLADLPTNWNSWKPVVYPAVNVGKQVPSGHKLQVRLTQPTLSTLPVNFQFTIEVRAHCLKSSSSAAAQPDTSPSAKCASGLIAVRTPGPNGTMATKCVKK